MKKDCSSFYLNYCKRHITTCLIIFVLILFSLASYWMYFHYISSAETRQVFTYFYFSVDAAFIFLAAFTFIKENHLKLSRPVLYKTLFYLLLSLIYLSTLNAFFISLTVQHRIIRFFNIGLEQLITWFVALMMGVDLFSVGNSSRLTLPTIMNLLTLVSFVFCIMSIILIIAIRLGRRIEDKPDSDKSKSKISHDFMRGNEKRSYRNLSFGLVYKPIP